MPGTIRLPAMKESEFMRQVIALAHLRRWRVAHFRPGLTMSGKWRTAVQADGAGFVDLVLVRERVIFAELKVPRGKCSAQQKDWHAWLKKAGAEMYVWFPGNWAEIERLLA